jgi:hypothetical protein
MNDVQTPQPQPSPHEGVAQVVTQVPPGYGPQQSAQTQPPAPKKKRVFMWFFLAIQVLFILWIITGLQSAGSTPSDCGSLSQEACNTAQNVGTGIGAFLVIVLWCITDFLLAVVYGVYRLAKRS